LRSEAPKVTLLVDHLAVRSDHDLDDFGDIQLRVCAEPALPGHNRKRLLVDRFVVAMRRDHPAASKKMTPEIFLALPHLKVASAIVGSASLDAALESQGVGRRVAMTVPSMGGVLPIIIQTDLCVILPEIWISLYVDPARLAIRPLPVPAVSFTVDQLWHSRDDREAGNRWLRSLIEEEFPKMRRESARQWLESDTRNRRPTAAPPSR
jgi:DNA-binding transcriptional LysR family regulator